VDEWDRLFKELGLPDESAILGVPDPEPALLRAFARIKDRTKPKDVKGLCAHVEREISDLEERVKASLAALDYKALKYAADELYQLSRWYRLMCSGL